MPTEHYEEGRGLHIEPEKHRFPEARSFATGEDREKAARWMVYRNMADDRVKEPAEAKEVLLNPELLSLAQEPDAEKVAALDIRTIDGYLRKLKSGITSVETYPVSREVYVTMTRTAGKVDESGRTDAAVAELSELISNEQVLQTAMVLANIGIDKLIEEHKAFYGGNGKAFAPFTELQHFNDIERYMRRVAELGIDIDPIREQAYRDIAQEYTESKKRALEVTDELNALENSLRLLERPDAFPGLNTENLFSIVDHRLAWTKGLVTKAEEAGFKLPSELFRRVEEVEVRSHELPRPMQKAA